MYKTILRNPGDPKQRKKKKTQRGESGLREDAKTIFAIADY
jgi:hypothetical protein